MGTLAGQGPNQGHPGCSGDRQVRTVGVVDTALPPSPRSIVDDIDDSEPEPEHEHEPDVDTGIAGGVASYLGRQLGVDPLVFRLAFVLLTLVGGVGVVLYAGLWLSLVIAPAMGWGLVRVAAGTMLVVGIPVMLLLSGVRAMTGWPAVVLLLAGLAVVLWQPRRPLAPPAPLPDGGSSAARPVRRARRPERVTVAKPPRPPREPSVLGRATVGIAIVVAAVGALVDDGNGGRFHPEQWLGAAALVCGVGLLAGMVVGRARWLVLPAVAFAATGLVAGEFARLGIPLGDGPLGDRYVYLSPDDSSAQQVRTGIGDVYVQVDSRLAPSQEVVIDARTAIGTVYVQVDTTEVEVEVRGRTDHGQTELDGSAAADVVTLNAGAGGDGRVVVDAWVGIGDVVVYQAYSDDAPLAAVATLPPGIDVPDSPIEGDLVAIDPYVSATADGWIVLGNAEVVVDPDDRVVAGDAVPLEEWTGAPSAEGAGAAYVLLTSLGEFRLLPRSLLLTPDGRVVDLMAIRASVAAADPLPAIAPNAPTTTGARP